MKKNIKETKYIIYDYEKRIDFITIAKKICNCFQRFFYGVLLLNIVKPRKKDDKNFKYDVSICAIFKDEADYLKEWIEYHRIVGVSHFYLYNNNSTDNYIEVLNPYINIGLVTLIDWPMKQGQMQAYQNWADNYKNESKWVGFIDIDEFVVPNKDNNIYDFLKKYDYKRPVIIIYWKYFGTSGLKNRDKNSLVTEDFTIGWRKYADIGKYFFNTRYEYQQNFKRNKKMHAMWGKLHGLMLPPVNVFNKVCTCGFNPVYKSEMPIQINHYLLKSYAEYVEKKSKRGGGVNPVGVHDMEYFYYHESFCQSVDNNISKYMIKLKNAMEDNKE